MNTAKLVSAISAPEVRTWQVSHPKKLTSQKTSRQATEGIDMYERKTY